MHWSPQNVKAAQPLWAEHAEQHSAALSTPTDLMRSVLPWMQVSAKIALELEQLKGKAAFSNSISGGPPPHGKQAMPFPQSRGSGGAHGGRPSSADAGRTDSTSSSSSRGSRPGLVAAATIIGRGIARSCCKGAQHDFIDTLPSSAWRVQHCWSSGSPLMSCGVKPKSKKFHAFVL